MPTNTNNPILFWLTCGQYSTCWHVNWRHAPLISKTQSWLGMINWLQLFSYPALAILSSVSLHCTWTPLALVILKLQNILSTSDLGLQFTSKPNATLQSYIHFPLYSSTTPDDALDFTYFSDTNWGTHDASRPSITNVRLVSIGETCHSSGSPTLRFFSPNTYI
jgi:hypothetical protein